MIDPKLYLFVESLGGVVVGLLIGYFIGKRKKKKLPQITQILKETSDDLQAAHSKISKLYKEVK